MSPSVSTVERALELARSGICRSVDDIRRALKSEGYEAVDSHLQGSSLTKQLKAALGQRGALARNGPDEQ